jgi:hypothetical protein
MHPGFLVKHQFDLQVVITLFFWEKWLEVSIIFSGALLDLHVFHQ